MQALSERHSLSCDPQEPSPHLLVFTPFLLREVTQVSQRSQKAHKPTEPVPSLSAGDTAKAPPS